MWGVFRFGCAKLSSGADKYGGCHCLQKKRCCLLCSGWESA